MESNPARGVQVVATTILNPPAAAGGRRPRRRGARRPSSRRSSIAADRSTTSCASRATAPTRSAHRSRSSRTTMAPALAGSPRVNGHRDYIVKAMLHGLTGPVDGKTYTDVMIPMGSNDDEWIAAVALVRAQQLRQHAADSSRRPTSRACAPRPQAARRCGRVPELTASLPAQLFTDGWKVDGEPQRRRRRRRADADRVERRRAATGRACGSRSSCRRRETVTEIQFQSPAPAAAAARRDCRGRRVGRRAGRGTFGLPARLQGRSLDGRHVVDAGGRRARHAARRTIITFAPVAGEVRPHEPDGDRRGRAGVVDPEPADLRDSAGRRREVGVARLIVTPRLLISCSHRAPGNRASEASAAYRRA